jgi:hypothetical protein
MSAFSVSVEIHAPPERVWRALTEPDEVIRWSDVSVALDAPADYPQPGHHVRWIMSSRLPRWMPADRDAAGNTILHDRPLHVVPQRLLRAEISFGPVVLDETYRVEPEAALTRVAADVHVRVRVPLAGPLIARVYALGAVRSSMQASLRALKRHCETLPPG